MKRILLAAFSLSVLLCAFIDMTPAEELSAREILRHTDRARGNVGGIVWDISIVSVGEGDKQTQSMTVKVKNVNVLARFTNPPNMRDRMVLMKDRNMWFIRSGLQKPVSISPRQKLLGGAANGDIASTNYNEDYDPTLLGEEAVGAEPCYVFDLKAKNKQVTYDRIKYWVSKERLVGVKAEFFTLSGKLFKTAQFNYDNVVSVDESTSIPFVSQLIIRDAVMKEKVTTMTYSNIRVEKVPDSDFNINVLLR
ncbi:MAG TPA: outer membrane lipoprotein-sorting protein [Nitrospirota bacterium]